MPTLRDVVAVLDGLYDPRWAEDWDAVGTVAGDPDAEVGKVLFAVDPVQAVVEEAIAWGADLVVTHHPLYLKGVTSVAATSPKGRVVHDLISNGIALHTCHTNADSPALGVSESMAKALGLTDVRPLDRRSSRADRQVGRVRSDRERRQGGSRDARSPALDGSVGTTRRSSSRPESDRSARSKARIRRSARSAPLNRCPRPASR